MARDLYISRGLSAVTITAIAKATRSLCDIGDRENFDIIRFLECEIYRIIPDFYLFIERDCEMNGSKAFTTEDSLGIVVAESVYNDACNGLFYAKKILAHEFGHILLHHNKGFETKHFTLNGYKKQIKGTETYHSAEWQADTFAIVLLIHPSQVCPSTDRRAFEEKYRISRRQSEFVLSRLNSLRMRGQDYDRVAVRDVIKSLMSKRPQSILPIGQYELFA